MHSSAPQPAGSDGLRPVPMRLTGKVVDILVNPPRLSDRPRLKSAVSGKTVLVTGASYGIGEATASKLAAAGATVLLVARSADRLDEVAASIGAGGGRAVPYPADLTDEARIAALTKQVNENHGPPDIVVSNAAKSIRRSLRLQYDRPHDFQRTIDTNYLGPIRLLLGLLPAMREHGTGHIVNVSTIGVRMIPTPRWGTYIASKGAFDMWLRSVAPELHADGIDITSVYMGLVHTRMSEPTAVRGGQPGLLLSKVSSKQPFEGYTDAEASEKKLVRNAFRDGDVWINTGDLMRPQGFRHAAFADRLGDTFRWKGENVATTDVEAAVSAGPGVEAVTVFGVQVSGADGRAGMAAVVLKEGHQFDGKALADTVYERLPRYAVPLFRVVDSLDQTSTFKSQKSGLRKQGYGPDVGDPLYVLKGRDEGFVPFYNDYPDELAAGSRPKD